MNGHDCCPSLRLKRFICEEGDSKHMNTNDNTSVKGSEGPADTHTALESSAGDYMNFCHIKPQELRLYSFQCDRPWCVVRWTAGLACGCVGRPACALLVCLTPWVFPRGRQCAVSQPAPPLHRACGGRGCWRGRAGRYQPSQPMGVRQQIGTRLLASSLHCLRRSRSAW